MYIPINDTSFEQSIFWPFDTESRINKLRLSGSISLSFKKRLNIGYLFFVAMLCKVNFKPGTRDRKHDDVHVTLRNKM